MGGAQCKCISRHSYKSELSIWCLAPCSNCNPLILPLTRVFRLGGIAPLHIHGAAGFIPVAWEEWTGSIAAGRNLMPPALGAATGIAGPLTTLPCPAAASHVVDIHTSPRGMGARDQVRAAGAEDAALVHRSSHSLFPILPASVVALFHLLPNQFCSICSSAISELFPLTCFI